MAVESAYTRREDLPPNYLAQFYSGVPGANVPGIMPLLNQELVNRMSGFGVEGANPYTYSGNRIADFAPAEREAMRMTAEGMGSYLPYFQRAEQMTESGLGAAQGAYGDTRNLIGQAVRTGEQTTGEAMNLLRRAPEVGASATRLGLGQVTQAGGTLGAAEDIAGRAGVDLGEAQNIIRGADPSADIQRAQQMTLGSQFDPTPAGGVIGGSLGRLGESAATGYGSTGQFDPTGIGGFYNPFEDQVVKQTMKDVREGLDKGLVSQNAQAVGAGAFGGSRGRLRNEELAESTARGAAQQVGAIRSGGYQDAARRAQSAFEAQQGRQAGQANLLSGLGAQQANIGSQLGQLGLGASASNRAMAGQFGQMGLSGSGAGLARGQALGQMGLAGQQGQLGQAGAMGQLAGQRAGMGTQIAGMGGNLAGLYGATAGGLGSLGGNLANIYGGAGRDVFGAGAQLGQLGMGAGQQMAGYGQGASGLLGTDIARMQGMGATQRGMDQRGLDLAYQNFVGQYNLPMETIGQAGTLASGMAPSMGGTTLQSQQAGSPSNPWMQAAGTGLTAYGAFNSPYGGYGGGGGQYPSSGYPQPNDLMGPGGQPPGLAAMGGVRPTGGVPGGGYWNNPNDIPPVNPQNALMSAGQPSVDPFMGCPSPKEHIQLANNDWILAGELKVGDKVITSEEPQKVTFAKTIEDSPRREVLFTEGDSIVTSPSHPYFVKDKGFVDVEDLKEGDAVGDLIVSEIKPFSDGPVIHISVDKAQTYMLRGGTEENPVPALSHNKSRPAPPRLNPQAAGLRGNIPQREMGPARTLYR